MVRKLIIVLMCFVLCLSFSSCVKDTSSKKEQDISTTTTEEMSSEPDVLMLEDILESEGVYCLHADGSITTPNKLTQIEDDRWIYTGEAPLVIDRTAGDSLIYVGGMVRMSAGNGEQFEMDFYAEQFYWSGDKVNLMTIEEFEGVELEGEIKENGIFYHMFVDRFFEPFGLEFHGDASMSSAENGYLLSKEPTTYSYGYYDGTEWIGTISKNDSLFYDATLKDFKKGYAFRSDVIKGKNGYFTIDLSDVEAGLYINEFDKSNHIYAIDIK